MKGILLATDFSESAGRAAEVAEAIARRSGEPLVMVHVVPPPATLPQELAADARIFEAAIHEQARKDLSAAAGAIRTRGLTVAERLVAGDPAEVIAALARELDVRLVVVGSHGRRGLARLLLGSVARGTLSLVDRPVLVSRPGRIGDALAGWVQGQRALRVVVGLDRSPGTTAALAWVAWLRGIGRVDVRLVHAYNTVLETLRQGLRPATEIAGDLPSVLERDLRDFAGTLPGEGHLAYVMRDDGERRPAEVLARDVQRSEADLVVVGAQPRSRLERVWLGSTGELLLRVAPVPVVCVPAASLGALESHPGPDEVC